MGMSMLASVTGHTQINVRGLLVLPFHNFKHADMIPNYQVAYYLIN